MKLKVLFFLVVIGFLASSCENEIKKVSQPYKHIQEFDIDHGIINPQSYIEVGDAHSGKKISRADIGVNFGFGYSKYLPDSLNGKTILVDVDGWIRTGDLANVCELIVSANAKDSLLLWMGCGAKEVLKAPNQWSNVKHIVVLGPNITSKPNLLITILAHNIDARSYFDVDDLRVTFSEQENPSIH